MKPASASRATSARGSSRGSITIATAIRSMPGNLRPQAQRGRRDNEILDEGARGRTNRIGTDRLDHVETAELGMDRKQCRRSRFEPAGVVVRRELRRVEGELLAMRKPAGRSRYHIARRLCPRVQEGDSGAAEQPLESASDVEIDVKRADIDR